MFRKHMLRFAMLAALAYVGTTPVYAADCDDYCEGYANGFCAAQNPPQEAEYQGCTGDEESGYNCYFGCTPPA
jgi:hypothetical protein